MHRNGPGGWSTGIAFLLLLALHACVPRQALSEGEPEAGRLSQGEELAGIQSTATLDGKDNLRVEVEGTIQYPFQQVRAVLLDIAGFKKWFPSIGVWQILSSSPSSALVYGSQNFPWPMRDRDYVVLYVWQDHTDGRFTLEATAQSNALPKPGRGMVRVERMRSLWTLEHASGGSAIRYVWQGDPGIPLPDALARYGWQSHTNAVVEELAREVARRESPSPP